MDWQVAFWVLFGVYISVAVAFLYVSYYALRERPRRRRPPDAPRRYRVRQVGQFWRVTPIDDDDDERKDSA